MTLPDASEPLPGLASFRFDVPPGKPPWCGTVTVDGHELRTVTSFDVHADSESVPAVTLTLDVGTLELPHGNFAVSVSDETREALISIGWTPPAVPCGTCSGTGWVCECHTGKPWGGMCCDGPPRTPGDGSCRELLCAHGACHCGGAGAPCRGCNPDGRAEFTRIAAAVPPDVPQSGTAVPDSPPQVTCSVDYPITEEQALGWAQQTSWLLAGYYKFAFTFEAYCTVAYPDDPEAHEVEARAIVSGAPEDFYRFNIEPNETLTWDELCYVATPDLIIREDGKTLIEIPGHES